MKVFVTGCLGFIGSNFIHYYLKKHPDSQIVNYDKVTYAGNHDNLKDVDKSRYSFIKGDICNYSSLRRALEEHTPDIVVSAAAETHVDNSIHSAQEFIQTNVAGAEVVLRCIKDLEIPKLVFISTDEVYGSLEEPLEADESYAFRPNSPYSASKTAGDVLCRAYYKTYNTPVCVIRGSNCYGPRQFPEKLIPLSLVRLFNKKPIPLYGTGKNIREWIYTEDFCSGIEMVMMKGKIGEAYNLGGGKQNRIDNYTIACGLLISLGLIKEGESSDKYVEYVADRKGHDQRYALDSSKLKKLGWKPKYDLNSALTETAKWYQDNEWWWKPLLKK